MSEKVLTELPWKALVVKHKLKDTTVTKALVEYAHCKEDDFDARLSALGSIEKAASALKKAEKGNKDVVDHLDDIVAGAGKERKAVEAAQKESADGGDEDAVDPASVKKKVLGSLATVKATAPTDPQLGFMAVVTKKNSAVLLSPNPTSLKAKLMKILPEPHAGATYFHGECRWEENSYTFVLEKVPGGLAKKLKKALLAETETSVKVRVRSFDGKTVSDSENPNEPEEMDSKDLASEEEPMPTSQTPPPPPPNREKAELVKALGVLKPKIDQIVAAKAPIASEIQGALTQISGLAKEEKYAEALQQLPHLVELVKKGLQPVAEQKPQVSQTDDFKHRLEAILPSLKEAIAGGGEHGNALKLKMSEAGALARQGRMGEALALLAELEQLTGGKTTSTRKPVLPVWQKAASDAQNQIGALQAALKKTGDEQMVAIAEQTLPSIAGQLTATLTAALGQVDQNSEPARAGLPKQAEEVRALLNGELVSLLDANPFGVSLSLAKTLGGALDAILQEAA